MERLNVDFKGPLPTTNKNAYFLNVVDEFSRFPCRRACTGGPHATPPTAVPNLFHVIKDIFGNKNPDGPKKFYTTPAPGG